MISDYIEQVDDHNSEWVEWALGEIQKLALMYKEFTSDLLRVRMASECRLSVHPNAIGAAFKIAAQYRIIERVGFAKSQWPGSNGRIISLWKKAGGL